MLLRPPEVLLELFLELEEDGAADSVTIEVWVTTMVLPLSTELKTSVVGEGEALLVVSRVCELEEREVVELATLAVAEDRSEALRVVSSVGDAVSLEVSDSESVVVCELEPEDEEEDVDNVVEVDDVIEVDEDDEDDEVDDDEVEEVEEIGEENEEDDGEIVNTDRLVEDCPNVGIEVNVFEVNTDAGVVDVEATPAFTSSEFVSSLRIKI